MSSSPLVSIIMPCFNSEGTLPAALASIRLQTYSNWECVLVDDGSARSLEECIAGLNDPRIRYFRHETNRGRGAARQTALEQARGEFIAMLDADDWIYPEKLERQTRFLVANPAIPIVSSGMVIVDPAGKLLGVRRLTSNPDSETFPSLSRPGQPWIPYAPAMIRSNVARQARYDAELRVCEDLDYLLSLMLDHPYAVLADTDYVYNETGSATLPRIVAYLDSDIAIMRKHRSRFPVGSLLSANAFRLKKAIYRAAFSTGCEDLLLQRRNRKPGAQDEALYSRNRDTVLEASKAIASQMGVGAS